MKTVISAIAACVALATAGGAIAAPAKPVPLGREARIPFVDHDTIHDFRADGNHGLWIQDQRRNWYYAKTFGPCFGLDFVNAIGVVTRGTTTLDKFGQILVDGRTCQLSSLVTSAGPPPKKKKKVSA
jgi:hypothetical protein